MDDSDHPPPLVEINGDGNSLPIWLSRPEIRYHVKGDGEIIGIDTPEVWEKSAVEGEGEEIRDPCSVVGSNLLDTMSPFYKRLFGNILRRVSEGRSGVVSWRYSADSPGVCRHFMLTITRLKDGSMLFSSTQLDEHLRTPVFEHGFEDNDSAAVEICGWCQKLRHRDGAKWQSPDTFHSSLSALGVTPPKSLAVKHVACEVCSKELSHNGMAWVPGLPRSVTDTHCRLSLICISRDQLLLRELTVRVCATRPWHALTFPITDSEDPTAQTYLSLTPASAIHTVKVFILNNPSAAAIATDCPHITRDLLSDLATPIIGIAATEAASKTLLEAGCKSIVHRPQWKQLKRALSDIAK
eukprot:TRINITY_DN13538_c0_g1_i3.p1 TRINITY_DN13538_c0_g1~~TRINITY_DN13538_c0_g1_i3.p1  ORF type:complete len:354 (+),score=48.33 TRINITY_DN13538_c0_g1_i3:652-1713(+)